MRRCNARTNYNGQRHGTLTRNLPWRINVINVTRGPLLVNNRLITPDRCLICAVFEHARNRSPSSASMDFQFAACINRPIRCYFFRSSILFDSYLSFSFQITLLVIFLPWKFKILAISFEDIPQRETNAP